MYEEFFRKRLVELRMARNTSARDMSLSLGQSESYINKIENGKAFPSMQVFFYICDYLKITPQEFFDESLTYPLKIKEAVGYLKKLDEKQLENINNLLKGLVK